MKKLTAKILLVCILALQIFMLVSCYEEATEPAVTTPAATTVITPSGNETPTDPENPETPTTPETPATPQNPGTPETPEPPATPVVSNEIKNIILIIGDGMGLSHITAGQMMYQKTYGFTNWQFTTSNTDSVNSAGEISATTDSAAGGTALATGTLTKNYYVGKDHQGNDLQTILDLAKAKGKRTGIVTTDVLYGATPAAFSAHSLDREKTDEIIASQITSGVDFLCGHRNEKCSDQKTTIEANGYTYCRSLSKIDEAMNAEKIYSLLDLGGDYDKAMNATVALKDAALHALTFLDRDEDGFALMIEQAHIDKASHQKHIQATTWAVNSLNDTVEAIMEWLGDRTDTAIVITADHETGGLSVSKEAYYTNSIQALVANAEGVNPLMYYHYSTTAHTSTKVGVFVYGIQADFAKYSYYSSAKTIKNINVYDLLADLIDKPATQGQLAA